LYDPLKNIHFSDPVPGSVEPQQQSISDWKQAGHADEERKVFQVKGRYLVTSMLSGMVIIDAVNASERIIYERLVSTLDPSRPTAQFQLLSQKIQVSHQDAELLTEYLDFFNKCGFEITPFGNNAFVVHAIPSGTSNKDIEGLIEATLEALKSQPDQKITPSVRLARSLAKSMALRQNRKLHPEELNDIVEQLFACNVPDITPDGKPTMFKIGYDELMKKFK
jgi:DNA mismatch repair protein MutL